MGTIGDLLLKAGTTVGTDSGKKLYFKAQSRTGFGSLSPGIQVVLVMNLVRVQ